jgi:hypothetical protein
MKMKKVMIRCLKGSLKVDLEEDQVVDLRVVFLLEALRIQYQDSHTLRIDILLLCIAISQFTMALMGDICLF